MLSLVAATSQIITLHMHSDGRKLVSDFFVHSFSSIEPVGHDLLLATYS
jgi:hypothetical protein